MRLLNLYILFTLSFFCYGQKVEFERAFKEAKFPYDAPTNIPCSVEEVALFHSKTLSSLSDEQVKKSIDVNFNSEDEVYYGLHKIKVSDKVSAYVVLHLSTKLDDGSFGSAYYQLVIKENGFPKMILDISWRNTQAANPDYGEPASNTLIAHRYELKNDLLIEFPRNFDYLTNEKWEGESREYSLSLFEQINSDDEGDY